MGVWAINRAVFVSQSVRLSFRCFSDTGDSIVNYVGVRRVLGFLRIRKRAGGVEGC